MSAPLPRPKPISIRELARMYVENAKKVLEKAQELAESSRVSTVNLYKLCSAVRIAGEIIELGEEGVIKELLKLSNEFGGCVACAWSRPFSVDEDPSLAVSLAARKCVLGEAQDRCRNFKRLEL